MRYWLVLTMVPLMVAAAAAAPEAPDRRIAERLQAAPAAASAQRGEFPYLPPALASVQRPDEFVSRLHRQAHHTPAVTELAAAIGDPAALAKVEAR